MTEFAKGKNNRVNVVIKTPLVTGYSWNVSIPYKSSQCCNLLSEWVDKIEDYGFNPLF